MADLSTGQKVFCKSCSEDIFLHSRLAIRCIDCDDFDLCVDCFASRVELGQHRPDHGYRFIDNRSFSLFNTEWTAVEHLRLLNAVEQFGYGNWEDIARHINAAGTSETGPSTNWSKKTAIQAKEEFCEVFLHSTIAKYTWNDEKRGRAHDHTIDNFLTPQVTQHEAPPNLTLHEAVMLGYFPKRDDFELEFDNEAESLVSQLDDFQPTTVPVAESTVEDEELDAALKMAHIEMYKSKLRERERRKRVARDHQLICQYFQENPLAVDRKSSQNKPKKAAKDPTLEKLKIWAELLGVREHQNFMATMAKERDIKNKIKDLNRFRKNGITSKADANEYELQRLRRNQRRKLEKRKLLQLTGSHQIQPGSIEIDYSSALSPPNSVQSEDLSNGSQASMFQLQTPSLQNEKLTIERLPGYDILSVNEKKLCTNLRLTPAHYISYKTCLLANHLQKKKGQTPKPLNPSGLDKNNRKIIFNFLMRAGWITAY